MIIYGQRCSQDYLVVVVLLLVLLFRIFALVVLQACNERLFALVLHLDELGVGLEGGDGDGVAQVVVVALLIYVARQLLNLQVVEALVHQQVDADHLVELVDAQAADRLEDPEEDRAEDGAPSDNDKAA